MQEAACLENVESGTGERCEHARTANVRYINVVHVMQYAVQASPSVQWLAYYGTQMNKPILSKECKIHPTLVRKHN